MEMDPDGAGQWTEVPFLAALSIGFWAVYFRARRHWWALIPAGMLLTTSVVTAVTAAASGAITGAVFLIGAALTFVLVAVLPGGASRHRWAWIPATVLTLGAIGVLLNATGWITLLNIVWPVAVILAGESLILRALGRRSPADGSAREEGTGPRPEAAGDR